MDQNGHAMPRAQILTTQATLTLEKLHAELGGKILDNKAEAKRLAAAMVHVEAVLKMLQPGYDVRPIAVRRRKPNPYFKRGTVWRSALDVLRGADSPAASMPPRIAPALAQAPLPCWPAVMTGFIRPNTSSCWNSSRN